MPPDQLRVVRENAQRLGRSDIVEEVTRLLESKGVARRSDYRHLKWNQQTVEEALRPFADVARSVAGNGRTAYTPAGGFRIGRKADDPERMFVDSYSAIKKGKLNAEFVAYVKKPGDEAYFHLNVDKQREAEYGPNELDQALVRWREIAARAGTESSDS